jgi:hypothetical protein
VPCLSLVLLLRGGYRLFPIIVVKKMGYTAATGRGTSRTDTTGVRDLAPTAFGGTNPEIPRNFAAPEGRRFQLAQQGWAACFSLRASHGRSGRKGGRGESPAQKHGPVCADHLPKKRTARASGVFTGALTTVPIKRESPLRQSADRKKFSCRPLAAPNARSMIKGWGATLLSSRVE